MIIETCKSYYGNCPCLYCGKNCFDECPLDTEKLCKIAREYCESVHREKGESHDN